jgi:hypothetical protein
MKKQADKEIENIEDQELGQIGQTLWINRLERGGFTVLPLQTSLFGNGPDLVAFGTPPSTDVFTIVLGEVKATSGTGLTSLLSTLQDGAIQMSLSWVTRYTNQIVNTLVDYIGQNASLIPGAEGQIAKVITSIVKNGSLDLYLLRARYYQYTDDWVTQGFQLVQIGRNNVSVSSDGSIEELDEAQDEDGVAT